MDTTYIFESFLLQRIKDLEAQYKEHYTYKDAWKIEDPDERRTKMFYPEEQWWNKFYNLGMAINQLYIIPTGWNNPLANDYLKAIKEKEEADKKEAEEAQKKLEKKKNKKGS